MTGLLQAKSRRLAGRETARRALASMLLLSALGVATEGAARAESSGVGYAAQPVAPGVVLFRSPEPGLGNVAAAISGHEAVVVDATGTPATAEAIVGELRHRGVRNLRALVITHWHDDHVWGIQAFEEAFPGVAIVAHDATDRGLREQAIPRLAGQIQGLRAKLAERAPLLERGVGADGEPLTPERRAALEERQRRFEEVAESLEQVRPTLPNLVLRRDWTIRLEGLSVVVRHLGRGHTEGDLVVHLPEAETLIAGDLVTFPIPAAAEAFPLAWVEALKEIDRLPWKKLVPGHGPMFSGREEFADFKALLEGLVSHVRSGRARGLESAELAESADFTRFVDRYLEGDARLHAAFRAFFVEAGVESVLRELEPQPSPGDR